MALSDGSVEATVAVSDLERSKRFYEGQLGLVPGDEEEQAVRYPCSDGTRIFIYVAPENAGKSTATIAGWLLTTSARRWTSSPPEEDFRTIRPAWHQDRRARRLRLRALHSRLAQGP